MIAPFWLEKSHIVPSKALQLPATSEMVQFAMDAGTQIRRGFQIQRAAPSNGPFPDVLVIYHLMMATMSQIFEMDTLWWKQAAPYFVECCDFCHGDALMMVGAFATGDLDFLAIPNPCRSELDMMNVVENITAEVGKLPNLVASWWKNQHQGSDEIDKFLAVVGKSAQFLKEMVVFHATFSKWGDTKLDAQMVLVILKDFP